MLKKSFLLYCLSVLFFSSCEKESENPFDALDHSIDNPLADTTSASSITGLQKNIFSVKCAIPSCHGGNFEPDFRTVQSSYNTLVYHKVKKNTKPASFTFRVIPFDTAGSWLHQRVTYDDTLIARMPLYALPLTSLEIQNINTWILNGAPDVNGKIADKPNENPKIIGYTAYDQSDIRIDTTRSSWSDPFVAPSNQTIKILMYITDGETNKFKFEGNMLKLSLDQDDFSNAVIVNATCGNGPKYYGWVARVNTGLFPVGSQVFMRYYVKDPDHTEYVERPVQESYNYVKGNYSLIIQ